MSYDLVREARGQLMQAIPDNVFESSSCSLVPWALTWPRENIQEMTYERSVFRTDLSYLPWYGIGLVYRACGGFAQGSGLGPPESDTSCSFRWAISRTG